jgi:single-strand DNA-binding protein
MNLNRADLIGRVTRTPELKKLPSGVSVTSFGVATNHVYKNKAGEKIENVAFHNCVIFGTGAEVFSAYVVKGQEVYVSGRIDYREWEKKDGGKAQRTEIIVENFQFGQKPKGYQGGQESAATGAAAPGEVVPAAEEEVKIEDVDF